MSAAAGHERGRYRRGRSRRIPVCVAACHGVKTLVSLNRPDHSPQSRRSQSVTSTNHPNASVRGLFGPMAAEHPSSCLRRPICSNRMRGRALQQPWTKCISAPIPPGRRNLPLVFGRLLHHGAMRQSVPTIPMSTQLENAVPFISQKPRSPVTVFSHRMSGLPSG